MQELCVVLSYVNKDWSPHIRATPSEKSMNKEKSSYNTTLATYSDVIYLSNMQAIETKTDPIQHD